VYISFFYPIGGGVVMITDLAPYREYVDKFDLTQEQKLELVNAVWMIVESIYDYHIGINQLLLNNKTPKKNLDKQLPPSSIVGIHLVASN
jgi:hypothetical protein